MLSDYTLTFTAKDNVQGNCYKVKRLKNIGDKIVRKTFNDEMETVTDNN